MHSRRGIVGSSLAALVVAAAGCGGGSRPSPVQPPANLAYAANPAVYARGVAIAPNTPSSTGGAVASYSVSPALPAGLSLDGVTGVVSGTPTAVAPAAGYAVTAANAGGSTTSVLDITVREPVVFADDFESYGLGAFPSAGGWGLYYSGAGASSQYVDGTHAASGSQALHLVGGASCWSATAVHDVAFPQAFSYEVKVFVDQIVGCGCTQYLAEMGPTTGFHVAFFCDGNIYARLRYDPQQVVLLMPYQARTWYHVKVDADSSTRIFSVTVNGSLVGSGLRSLDTGSPTQFLVAAEHGASPTVWFDDVRIAR